MQLLDGKLVASHLKNEIKNELQTLEKQYTRKPQLTAVIVGSNPASTFYVQSKMKNCEEIGMNSELIALDESISEDALLSILQELNDNPLVDGYIVQLPLPSHIDEQRVIHYIAPHKDVDGFHPSNFGKLALGEDTLIPATPLGIIKMLEYYQIPTAGKHCVVLGRSHIVGTPMSLLMMQNRPQGNSTVTICHSKTKDLEQICATADILIAAIGKPLFVTKEMIKPGAVVIDVGINRIEDATKKSGYRIVGDVDFENVKETCSYITPVPGGVGLMTVAALMWNTMKAWKKSHGIL